MVHVTADPQIHEHPLMNRFLICFGLILTFLSQSNAQNSLSRKGRDLDEKAARAWEARDLIRAKSLYLQLLDMEPGWVPAHLRLAQIFEWEKQPERVAAHYQRAVQLAPDSDEVLPALQWLAKKAQEQEDYATAANYWKQVLKRFEGNKPNNLVLLAERQLASAEYALQAVKQPVPIERKPLSDTVNHLQLQFFPVLTADRETLIFTGLNEGGNEDIFISHLEKGRWTKPTSISPAINTEGNEGTCSISADGHTLVFTGCNREDGFGSCDLYITYWKNGHWTTPENMGERICTRYWESQPSLSADGSVLYFASDRPGGQGKADIWRTVRDEKGQWSEPVNLGSSINTPDDENAPFIHANGTTLFYASRGLPGMGGFDIFLTDLNDPAGPRPVNLGYPINNGGNQVGLFITADGKTAYYTEDRTEPGKKRSSRLFTFEIPDTLRNLIMPTRYVKGRVLDSETGKPVLARIRLYDLQTQELVSGFMSDEQSGEYLAVVNNDSHYALYVESDGYLFKSLSFDVTDRDLEVRQDIHVERLQKDKVEILNHVYFETGDYNLTEKSKLELDKLVRFMNDNRNVRIEVSGHTDDVGSDADNLKLSEKRAESVVNYLTGKGISGQRVQFKGYGETKPRVPNDSEENRRMNRRIEWRIL